MARRSDHTREQLHEMILDAAREIVEQDGLAGLTIRRIGKEIGYSSGTLYNLFDDLDDIVLHLNAATLETLNRELTAIPASDGVEAALHALADPYLRFVEQRPLLWGLLFQSLPNSSARPDWYYDRMGRLFMLLEDALDPIFGAGQQQAKRDAARILWSGLHGMCTLAAEGAVLSWDDVRRLKSELIQTYVAGLRHSTVSEPTRGNAADGSDPAG